MADLPEDKQPKQPQTSDLPVSDQPSVSQPAPLTRKLDETSLPPIKAEEKIATPEQKEIKKELSELGIPPEGGSKKTKVLLATLGVILLIATLPAAVYLVQQRQALQTEAEIFEGVARIYTQSGDQTTEVEVEALGENLDDKGNYTVTWSIKKGPQHNTTGEIQFLIAVERDMCPEANGQTKSQSVRYTLRERAPEEGGYCFTPWMDDKYFLITLNEANNYSETISVTTTQVNNVPCGSFQTEPWAMALNGSETFSMRQSPGKGTWSDNNCPMKRLPGYELAYEGKVYPNACILRTWGNLKTGKELSSCPPPVETLCISLGGEPDPSGLSPGDDVTLTCTGSSDPTAPIDHFEFRVSSDSGTPVELSPVPATKTNGEYQGQTTYNIPGYGCYSVECRACTSSDSSECTTWGQAQ